MDDVPLLILLLLASGFFSGAEIAFFSVSPERTQALKNTTLPAHKRKQIAILEKLKADPQHLLVTILLGNNVVNVAASALATMMATRMAADSGVEGNSVLVIGGVTGVMTFLLLLFGEITPKSFAHRHAVSFALLASPAVRFMQWVLAPIIWPMTWLIKKVSGSGALHQGLSEDELKAALELAEREGNIDADEKELAERVFDFGEYTVEAVMTPRVKVFALGMEENAFEAIKKISEEGHSRIPIYNEDLDKIEGILMVRDLLEAITQTDLKKVTVAEVPLHRPLKIPRTMRLDRLMREFQKKSQHMALVYDEHGGFMGLVTMEDLLEEIFGEIQDEQDTEEMSIVQTSTQTFVCSGDMELEQIEDFINEQNQEKAPENYPWEPEDENKSISFLVLEMLGRFPHPHEKVRFKTDTNTFTLEITKVDADENGRIEEVKLSYR